VMQIILPRVPKKTAVGNGQTADASRHFSM